MMNGDAKRGSITCSGKKKVGQIGSTSTCNTSMAQYDSVGMIVQ